MIKGAYVYIVTNKHNTVLYVGVTTGLVKRMWEHRSRLHPVSFASRYNLKKLVHFQHFETMEEAVLVQEKLSEGSRVDLVRLIEDSNSSWNDLSDTLQAEKLLNQMSLF